MIMKLSELIKQERFTSAAQEAMLNVVVTSSWLMNEMSAAMAPFGITPAQYNVLRILRGSHPHRLTCSDIGERLLDRTPDVTRLLNRLQRAGLVERDRADYDRRVVEVGITEKGLTLLGKMFERVEGAVEHVMSALSEDEQQALSAMLEQVRRMQHEPAPYREATAA